MRRAAHKPRPSGETQLDLALLRPADRIGALGREKARLLREIARRRKELARLENEVEATSMEVQSVIAPLLEQQRSVEREIHPRFAALLAPGRLAKPKRARVRDVYLELQRVGLIGPPLADAPDHGDHSYDGEPHGGFADALPMESATRPPDGERHRILRSLFKRLVVALHPDRAEDDAERARRTDAMKDLTRAYELGDLARMIELEAILSRGSRPGQGPDERAQIVEALERTVTELKAQLRQVLDELRRMRRSDPFRAARDFQRIKKIGSDALERVKAVEQARLDDLVVARDFVSAFDAGKISFREFLDGPSFPSETGGSNEGLLVDLLEEMLDGLDVEPESEPRRRRRRGAVDPIPF